MKILFVHQGMYSFVKKDLEILQDAHEVRSIEFNGNFAGIFNSLFQLWKGVVWCDATFSWFGKLHAFFAVLFSKMLGKKSIVIAGGDDVARVPEIKYGMFCFWWKRWCPSFVFRYADLILPVSRISEKDTLVNAKTNPKKVRMIYHGFLTDFDGINSSHAKENIVITIGAVSNETIIIKGLMLFVESAKLLPDTRFLLIGPDKDGALSRLKELAPKNVEFLGGVYGQELVEICSRAKVYVQVSVHESFGCSLAEAMSYECIPVVSRNGAIPEIAGDVGIYVDELTPENISQRIRYTLSLPDEYGKKARNRIIELFPLDRRKEKLLNVVERLGRF